MLLVIEYKAGNSHEIHLFFFPKDKCKCSPFWEFEIVEM